MAAGMSKSLWIALLHFLGRGGECVHCNCLLTKLSVVYCAHFLAAVWHWGQTAKMELVRNGRTLLRDLFEEDTGAADAGGHHCCVLSEVSAVLGVSSLKR